MMNRLLTIALAAVLALSMGACDTIALDEVEPAQSISSEEALSSLTGIEALLVNMYDRLQGTGRYAQVYMLYPDGLADNVQLVQGNSSNRYPGVVANARNTHMTAYGGPYSTINEANNIIASVGDVEIDAPDPQSIRDRIRGEALFLRALSYFDLVRTHAYEPGREVNGFSQGVILRTEPTRSVEDADFRARAPNTEVYNQVVADLNEATGLLAGNSRDKFHANEAAAWGLLSRVHLYLENWSEAETAATNALNATNASLVVDTGNGELLSAWLSSTHPESVMELQMTSGQDGASTNSNGALQALTIGAPERRVFTYEVIPSNDLLATHEEGDARFDLYANDTPSNPSEGQLYMQKYTGTLGEFADRLPIIRVAELYLNRAEARAEQGNTTGAQADLNAVRNARTLDDVTASGDALIEAILTERRLELAFEGHRFFDLKRRARDIPKPQTAFGVLDYEDFRILAPFPNAEVQSNPQLDQNPGY